MLARCGLRAALLGQAFSTTTRAAVTAQALRYHEFGSPESVLKLEKVEVADPKDGEVLVKFKAAPINPADINQIQGVYGIQPKLPAVAGNEGVAVVEKLGANVKGLAIGDRVIPSAPGFGTWTTHAVAPSSSFIKVSSKIPLEYAATLSVNPCTALRLLNDFVALKKGDVIVQNGANSMVGQSVIQLAKQRGITTINVIRQRNDYEEVVKRLKAFGADFVITEDLAASHDFRDLISGLPAPRLALNCVGGKNATEIARLLGNDGVLVTYGGMSKKPVQIPTSLFIFKNLQLKGFWLSQWLKDHSAAERDAMFTELTDLITQDKFRLFVENHRFDQFQQALITNQEQRDRKVVLSFD